MNRLLIALLAMLTGLVAQVSPAAAAVRAGGETEIGAPDLRVAEQVAVNALERTAPALSPEPRGLWEPALVAPLPWQSPSVLIGIDRARE